MNDDIDQPQARWFNRYHSDFLLRCWEDEVFLFNPHTGHTHILNRLSADILQCCAVGPLSETELVQAATGAERSADAEILAQEVGDHLWQLQELGLLEREQP